MTRSCGSQVESIVFGNGAGPVGKQKSHLKLPKVTIHQSKVDMY